MVSRTAMNASDLFLVAMRDNEFLDLYLWHAEGGENYELDPRT